MYALQEVSYYGCPDTLFDLSSTLYRVVDCMPITMKMGILSDLEKIVDAYKDEPSMTSVLRNIRRFMDEELLPHVDFDIDKPSESDAFPSSDKFFASGYEDYYMDDLEGDDDDESQYYTAEEVQLPLRKSSPLRFDKLSVVCEVSDDDSVFLNDEDDEDDEDEDDPDDQERAQLIVDDVTYDNPAPLTGDTTYDQPPSTLGDEDHPDDPKNSLNRTLASSAAEAEPLPCESALKKKKSSIRNRLTNLVRRVTTTVRRRFRAS